ncbi:M16 family metallopeptidase [Roseofilum capinflatum]|uniref:Pitrilysin family protein n=1 Tax=Roseofilum capinflatum BLCC-M114 TaxID=3022440 RepID=A0ABT7B8W2_9CYAN|nr:pitrilysin family protein [Roseofilum capinflatum]MDJ1175619.1 pitrilysin family protein [Roseofilum capinflatum BLCC-M114]
MAQLFSFPHFPARTLKLDSGLTVIHQQMSATPAVVADVWVKAGAIHEPEELPGLAHFLEHMVFKGTERIAPGIFDRVIENRGGISNAATSYDYAHFYINTAVPHIADTLPYLAEILLNPAIADEDFLQEREVVMSEIRQTQDDPDWLGFSSLLENLYPDHPYGRSVLGTQRQVLTHTPEQMQAFHHHCYQPENMTVVLVGDMSETQAIDLVSKSFVGFEDPPRERKGRTNGRSPQGCPVLSPHKLPPKTPPIAPLNTIRRKELKYPRLEEARLMMAWLGPGVHRLSDAYALDLISVLLASGRTSRLVRELQEEQGLVYGIGSDFSLQQDSSLFTITAWLEPKYLDDVESIIQDRLETLHTTPILESELRSCQRQLCNDYAFSTETPSQLAGLYGYYNTVAEARQAVSYPHRIQALTPEEIQRVARKYLHPDRYVVTRLKPLW